MWISPLNRGVLKLMLVAGLLASAGARGNAAPVSPASPGPEVAILRPGYSDQISGVQQVLIAVRSGRYTPRLVEMLVDQKSATGGPIRLDSLPSAEFNWDTRQFTDGPHKLTVRITDSEGYIGQAEISVYINNGKTRDTQPPGLRWLNPKSGDVLKGDVKLQLQAIDNFGIKYIIVTLNPAATPDLKPPLRTWFVNQPPYTFDLNTTKLEDGLYALQAVAWDDMENEAEAPKLEIGVANCGINPTWLSDLQARTRATVKNPAPPASTSPPYRPMPAPAATVAPPRAEVQSSAVQIPATGSAPQVESPRVETPRAETPRVAAAPVAPPRPGQLSVVTTVREGSRLTGMTLPPNRVASNATRRTAPAPRIAALPETSPRELPTTRRVPAASAAAPAPSVSAPSVPAPSVRNLPPSLPARSVSAPATATTPATPAARAPGLPTIPSPVLSPSAPQLGSPSTLATAPRSAVPVAPRLPVVASPAPVTRPLQPALAARTEPRPQAAPQLHGPNFLRSEPRVSSGPGAAPVNRVGSHLARRDGIAPLALARTIPNSLPALKLPQLGIPAYSPPAELPPALQMIAPAPRQLSGTGAVRSATPVGNPRTTPRSVQRMVPARPTFLASVPATRAREAAPLPGVKIGAAHEPARASLPGAVARNHRVAARSVPATGTSHLTVLGNAPGTRVSAPAAASSPRLSARPERLRASLPRFVVLPEAALRPARAGAAITLSTARGAATLPAMYTTPRAEKLRALATRHHLPLVVLAAVNGLQPDTTVAAGRQIVLPRQLTVSVDGKPVTGDVAPQLLGSVGVTPFRFIFERQGGQLKWDAKRQEVTARNATHEVTLRIGSDVAIVNNEKVMMDLAAFLLSGRTMVPVRFFERALQARVDWDPSTGRLYVAMAN